MKKTTPNFLLLLKQGFKGIFKFKIQFIIILVLSFLATFMLTITVSSTKRLHSDWDQIVGSVDRFDYVATTQIGNTAVENSGASMSDLEPVPLIDFINNTYVDTISEDAAQHTSNFNFILNEDLYKDQIDARSVNTVSNFLTRFMKQTDQNGFYALTKNYFNDNDLANYRFLIRNQLAHNLIQDIVKVRDHGPSTTEGTGYFTTSTIGFMIMQNPNFFNFLNADFKEEDYNNLTTDQKHFIVYLYDSMAGMAYWITEQGLTDDPNNTNPKLSDLWTGQTPDQKAIIFYELLMGSTPPAVKVAGAQDLIATEGYVLEAQLGADLTLSQAENKFLIVNGPVSNNNLIMALINKGYRGTTSPLNVRIDSENHISNLTFTERYDALTLQNNSSTVPFTKRLNLDVNYYNLHDLNDKNFNNPKNDDNTAGTMWQYHLNLTAWASGYNIQFRKEQILFDNITSRKFRYVVLNENELANFTILRGTMPTARNEVAISEQFARANHLKVGDYINIGQAPVLISGFATDTYSFFPAVDPNVPIPQAKTEAYVYGTKGTLHNIVHGFGGTSGNQDMSPRYFHFFLTNNKNEKIINKDDKSLLFINLQQDLRTNLAISYQNLKAIRPPLTVNIFANSPIQTVDNQNFFKLTDFNGSNFRLNWTLMDIVLKYFRIITYVASAIIAIIALIALIICIRKTITFNAKQIGILKSMGTDPWMIAVTYLAYGLVIMFIVVPIAWLLGSFMQIPFGYLFADYFSIHPNVIDFSWEAFLIAFLGFGVIALFISIFTAWLITRKPVLEIIKISTTWKNSRFVDFLKNKLFKNASFNTRFSLTLASSGKRPIFLLTAVVGLASLLISGSLALPSIANNAVRSYYKNVLYANSYSNLIPTMNSPLSKPGINYWQGNEKWDNNWVNANLQLDTSGTGYGYYLDPTGYMDSVSQSSPIPRYIFSPSSNVNDPSTFQNFTYAYLYVLQNPELFLTLAGNAFGDNFFTVLGQSFNIGTIDQFLGIILNANYELIRQLMGDEYQNDATLDRNKQILAQDFSSSLTAALPNLVSAVIGSISDNGGGNNGGTTWKDDIINAILTQVPPYIKSFIYKSPSRLEQFGISFNAETYTPKRETLITTLPMNFDNHSNVSVTGIDKGQNAYNLTAREKSDIYFTKAKLEVLDNILNGERPTEDVWFENVKIWNASTNTLTVPMIANRQAEAAFKLKNNKTLTNAHTQTRQLFYRTKDGKVPWQILPKYAWAYDDQDFKDSNLFANPTAALKLSRYVTPTEYKTAWTENQNRFDKVWASPDPNEDRWLDVYKMENNKFTYQNAYTSDHSLVRNTYLFNDFSLDPTTKQLKTSYVRPYYEYRNIKLFIPEDLVNEADIFQSSDRSSTRGPGPDSYYETGITDVPYSVRKAWGRTQSNDQTTYFAIRPYDLNYVDDSADPRGGGLSRLTNGNDYPYWLRFAFDSQRGPGALTYQEDAPVTYQNDLNINFETVGSLVSYESRLLLIDSNVANMLTNYSTNRLYGVQISYFDGKGQVDTVNNEGSRPWSDKLLTFDTRNVEDDVYVAQKDLDHITYLKGWDTETYAPLRWHTGKLSNIEEPEGLTSSVSFNVLANLGQYSLGLGYPSGLGMTTLIKNQVLLSSQRALINQIYSLTISIGLLLIIAIVITASLLIMLMGDIYIAQYQQFMILMRALGYSNWQIQSYAFGTVAIFSFIAWLVATIIAWVISYAVITSIYNRGFAIPYGFSWWPPLLSLAIIAISFIGSLLVSSHKARTAPVSTLMNEASE